MSQQAPRALIVGGGPAGFVAAGALLHRRLRVTWIDPAFRAGRLPNLGVCPSNTKLDLLVPHAKRLVPQAAALLASPGPARDAFDALAADAYQLAAVEADVSARGWVNIKSCARLFEAMSDALIESEPHLTARRGHVRSLTRLSGGVWRVAWANGARCGRDAAASAEHTEAAEHVVLATGGVPAPAPAAFDAEVSRAFDGAPPRQVPWSAALHPAELERLVGRDESVGVVGAGHTGVVVAQQLHDVLRARRVCLFAKEPVQLACFDAATGRYGAWGFKGLKGLSASWAARQGLVNRAPHNGPMASVADGRYSERLELHAATPAAVRAARPDVLIYCVGFNRGPLPAIRLQEGDETSVEVELAEGRPSGLGDQLPSGQLVGRPARPGARASPLPGLHGVGVGFAAAEESSGSAYPKVGFLQFTDRAAAIAQSIGGAPRTRVT
jgi:hypothetical protein